MKTKIRNQCYKNVIIIMKIYTNKKKSDCINDNFNIKVIIFDIKYK